MASSSSTLIWEKLEPIIKRSIVQVFFFENPQSVWSGFVIGQVAQFSLILTTAHCFGDNPDYRTDEIPDKIQLGVRYYGPNGPSKPYKATVSFLKCKSEILILSVELEPQLTYPKLLFARQDEWDLISTHTLMAVSHPIQRSWRAAVGRVCSDDFYFDGKDFGYDEKMIVFDHDLGLFVGSSGTALVNEFGHVVGLQAGEILFKYKVVSGVPFLQAADFAAHHKMEEVPKVNLDASHVITVPVHPCNLKYAVHVRYLSDILRSSMEVDNQDAQCSLNELIEKFLRPKLLGSSSSSSKSST